VRETGNSWFCKECHDALRENSTSRDACFRCGLNPSIRTCTCTAAWDFPFDRIYSIFDYDDRVKELVRNIKYHGKKTLARDLVRYSSHIDEVRSTFDTIVAVPLHWTRYRSRGYNQAEWFARGIASAAQIDLLPSALYRSRSTGTQTKLDRAERQKNMKNAFGVKACCASLVQGKRILLTDDVITTGATAGACADALLEAGCVSVSVMSIARD